MRLVLWRARRRLSTGLFWLDVERFDQCGKPAKWLVLFRVANGTGVDLPKRVVALYSIELHFATHQNNSMAPDEDDISPEEHGDESKPPRIRRWLLRSLLFVALVTAATIAGAYHLSQQEPEFYQVALRQTPEVAKQKGAELETTVMDIYNAVLEQGPWRGEVSQDQVNGWLAMELPEKFPELLPEDVVADPRVSIRHGEISIAGRAFYQGIKGIVVAKLDVFKTDQRDQFAIRFRSIYAGVIPIPIKTFADEISKGLNQQGYQTMWSELEGDAVLTVIVPEEELLIHGIYRLNIETIDIEDEKIIVSGTTINHAEEEALREEAPQR